MGDVRLVHGDALAVLETFTQGGFDACLCDPPYGYGFMGRRWDHGVPSSEVWREVLRCLRPGASLMAFGGTRTYHRLGVAIEDAGFEIRDSVLVPGVVWAYGSGFPKSLDVSKAIDAAAGAEREVVGVRPSYRPSAPQNQLDADSTAWQDRSDGAITRPATPEAATWSGYGTALKPSWEPVVWAMKPVDGTFARNALEHGVAGLDVDSGRVTAPGGSPAAKRRDTARRTGNTPTSVRPASEANAEGRLENRSSPEAYLAARPGESLGRFPANLILCHLPGCREVGTKRVRGSVGERGASTHIYGGGKGFTAGTGEPVGYADPDGTEEVPAWECVEGCPVLAMDRASGEGAGQVGMAQGASGGYCGGFSGDRPPTGGRGITDSGTASRFFQQCAWEPGEFEERLTYFAKAATAERMVGGERLLHPTMKPLALATYLARMLLPPPREDGRPRRLLVPFSGVGSEIIGALRAGWDEVVGIELDADGEGWVEKSARRILEDSPLFNEVEISSYGAPPKDET